MRASSLLPLSASFIPLALAFVVASRHRRSCSCSSRDYGQALVMTPMDRTTEQTGNAAGVAAIGAIFFAVEACDQRTQDSWSRSCCL